MLNILTFSFTLLFLKLLMVRVDNSVVNLTSNFVGVEPIWELERRWGKTFHVLKLFNNTTKAQEVSAWQTCCYHWIEYRVRQKAGTKRYSAISLIWQRSMLGSYTVVTFIWMENNRKSWIKSWATRCSNPRQQRKSV